MKIKLIYSLAQFVYFVYNELDYMNNKMREWKYQILCSGSDVSLTYQLYVAEMHWKEYKITVRNKDIMFCWIFLII